MSLAEMARTLRSITWVLQLTVDQRPPSSRSTVPACPTATAAVAEIADTPRRLFLVGLRADCQPLAPSCQMLP
jgi:hypothetical protein